MDHYEIIKADNGWIIREGNREFGAFTNKGTYVFTSAKELGDWISKNLDASKDKTTAASQT